MSTNALSVHPVTLAFLKLPLVQRIKPHVTVFNLTVVAVLGAATAGFVALIAVLLIIATNFNVLGLIE